MDFRTELNVPAARWSLDIGDRVVTMGSCFAQSMGQRFLSNKFESVVNPFGTTYHPLAIHRLLTYSIFQEYPAPHTYLNHQDTAFNYDVHSSLSATKREDLELNLHDRISSVHYALKDCRVLLLTYGTAWLYERTDTGEQVANCHRMPASMFSKRLTSIGEITDSFRKTLNALMSLNPTVKIILTLSPVRHIKDTLPLSSVSKSIVRVACHELAEEFDHVEYFPAYELLIDDLRDYRFYKEDLIHPTGMAEDYIWDKFSNRYFSDSTKEFLKKWETLQQALSHRPFQRDSNGHQQFLNKTLEQLEDLRSVINVDHEIQDVKLQLTHQPTPS